MNSENEQPRRDSWQGFGRPEKVVFYGRESEPWPAAEGRVCRVERHGFNGMMFVDDEAGGEVVASMGGTAKFWGLPL
jgi:hypothetical protein